LTTVILSSQENLAWASAQLHCYRKTSYSTSTSDKATELTEMIGRTALDAVTQAPGEVIVATKPKILFCDLRLQPGETKMCKYTSPDSSQMFTLDVTEVTHTC